MGSLLYNILSQKGPIRTIGSNPSSTEYYTNPNPVSETSAQTLPGELCHAHHPLGQTLSPHTAPHHSLRLCHCPQTAELRAVPVSQHVASPQSLLLWAEQIQGPQPPLIFLVLLIFVVFLWMLSDTSSQGEATSAESKVGQSLHSTAWHCLA